MKQTWIVYLWGALLFGFNMAIASPKWSTLSWIVNGAHLLILTIGLYTRHREARGEHPAKNGRRAN